MLLLRPKEHVENLTDRDLIQTFSAERQCRMQLVEVPAAGAGAGREDGWHHGA
jgi:hypothetical protein